MNTLPPETLAAYRDHGRPTLSFEQMLPEAKRRLQALASAGIDLDATTRELEVEGVRKFAASYAALLTGVAKKATALNGAA